MTSRRDALRALGSIAVLPVFSRVEDLAEAGRRAHALAELQRAGAMTRAPRVLTAAQYETVAQAAERIIPRTATPGATDARVADFIDVMLSDWYSAAERERFAAGLGELDDRARKLAGHPFAQAAERQQTGLLETLDRELQDVRQSAAAAAEAHWFGMLKHLTVWGYYTSRPGIVEELRVQLVPGRYDGNAKY